MADIRSNVESIIAEVKEIIQSKTGIVLERDRYIDLEIVVRSRLTQLKMEAEVYLQYLRVSHDELIIVASQFTIQETSFYRYKTHFDRLKLQILPLLKNRGRKLIRILSAGCATGEEPYTIAMIVADFLAENPGVQVSITGTDINQKALEFAQNGVYPPYKMRNIDAYYMRKFFTERKENGRVSYALNPEVKRMVAFRLCNLISEPFPLSHMTGMDVIFCENVIIYFRKESTQRLIQNFYEMLDERGYLFLGYSETLNMYSHNFFISWWENSYAYARTEPDDLAALPEPAGNRGGCETAEGEEGGLAGKTFDELLELLQKCCSEESFDRCSVIFKKLCESPVGMDERFYVIRSEFLHNSKEYMNAANECRLAINLSPQFLDAHVLLAVIYRDLEMPENFIYETRTSLYINPRSVLGHYLYAQYCGMKGDPEGYRGHMAIARRFLQEAQGRLETKIYPVSRETRMNILNQIMGFKEG
jgi:chemotaxis protein methyltransferase CheR